MKKFTKIMLGASLLSVLFAGCSNSLVANDTLDSPDIKAKVTENGVILLKWDEVKDASFYSVYSKAPGQQDWASVSGQTTDNWYVTTTNKTDVEYEFKVVASSEKSNLLSSESEVTVETPEAWVDTAAFAASDIKLTLVPNTLNKYELSFPVDAGFNYTAKLVKDTVAADVDAADLFVDNLKNSHDWYEDRYISSKNGDDISESEYNALVSTAEGLLNTVRSDLINDAEFSSYCSTNNITENDVQNAFDDLRNNGNSTTVYGYITNGINDSTNAANYMLDLDAYISARNTYISYRHYELYHPADTLDRGWINYASGFTFIEELDDDDNVVAPVFSNNVVAYDDGAEYRVVIQMSPRNTEVAKTKYILSSATIKFDSTGIVSAPEDCAVTAKNATTKVLTFTAAKYNGTEMAASNYRIYQLLTTTTKNSDLVYTGTTKVLTALGSPAKDTDLVTTRLNYVQYKLEASVKEAPASGIESYTYEFFVAYTDQNGDVSWYEF
ncbi:MAG: hypothetical protein J6J00_12410 [Treponema sp.]|nr:hypothetical protein [Treponema sp.]